MTLAPSEQIVDPFYPDSDGKPMAESDPTRDYLIYAVEVLKLYFAERPDVYVSGNLFIYYEQGVKDAVVSPDVFAVFGVEKRDRKSYKVWEEGGVTPDFILEITSESTRHTDRVEKRRIYAELGVAEYWQYDPTSDYLDPPLQGLRLAGGEYEPMTAGGNGSGAVAIRSAALGLELRLESGRLRFYDPATGEYLLSHGEERAARLEERAARRAAEAARQQALGSLFRAAEQLLATGMTVEAVAALLNLEADELRQRLGGD